RLDHGRAPGDAGGGRGLPGRHPRARARQGLMSVQAPTRPDLIEQFDAVVDGDLAVDRHEVFERLRADLPSFYSDRLDAWVFMRYHDVKDLLSSDERFGRPLEGPGKPVYGRSFLEMSGREHNKKV